MNFRIIGLILAGGAILSADQIVLKNGTTVVGEYLGGDTRTVRIAVSDRVNTYSVSDIRSISFGTESVNSKDPQTHPAGPSETPPVVVLPAFTGIIVNTVDPLLPGINKTFRATVDSPIYSGQQLVVPKGSPCVLVSVPKPQAAAPWDLVLELQSITINGRKYAVDSDQYACRTKFKGNVKVPFLLKDPLHVNLGS